MTEIPYDCFVRDENGNVKKLARVNFVNFLREQVPMFSINGTIFLYNEGIYKEDLKAQQLSAIVAKMIHASGCFNTQMMKEIVNDVKSLTLIDVEKLNKNPNIICMKNGRYRLWEDTFEEYNSDEVEAVLLKNWIDGGCEEEFFISNIKIPVVFDREAECPNCDKFISEVTKNEKYAKKLMEWIGYSLYYDNKLQKILIVLGSGGNGKGVLLRLWEKFIGTENCSAVTMGTLAGTRFAGYELFKHPLLNLVGDQGRNPIPDTGMLKSLSGEDLITVEQKYGQSFGFRYRGKLVFSMNEIAKVDDATEGWLRRNDIIKFKKKFQEDKDQNIDAKLGTEVELSGLFNRVVPLLRELLHRGEFTCETPIEYVKDLYATAFQSVRAFAESELEVTPDGSGSFIEKDNLYESYKIFCKRLYVRPLQTHKAFRNALQEVFDDDVIYRRRSVNGVNVTGWENLKYLEKQS